MLTGLIPIVITALYYYQQIQIFQKEYELKIEPILNVKVDIQGSEKCDFVVVNNGSIPISDIRINCWPRLVWASDFHVVSSTYGRIPWKTISKLVPHESCRFSIMDELLRAQADKRCQLSMNKSNDKNNYLPILLVYVTYRRGVDGKLYTKRKYVYVGEDIQTKKIIPFDMDEMPSQKFVDLKEKLNEYDKKRLPGGA